MNWRALRHPVFRALWIASVASNLGTWLQSVGAAWLMTSLAASATMVALVQAVTSLPMFLLSLPAGALADVMDRRRLLLVSQSWMLASAAVLGFLTLAGLTTPGLLLLFTFLLGLGTALNGPAWQAIVPELVPREDLPGAVTLQSIGFNIARAVGPAVGGLLVAAAGPEATFLLNAASFVGVLWVLLRWRRKPRESVLPGERFFGAMRTGLRYVRHAPEVRAVIVRGSTFVLCASALWALLPVVARTGLKQGPAGYGLLLAALGAGAISGAFALPRLKRRSSSKGVVLVAILLFAFGMIALGSFRIFWLILVALFGAGGAWLSLLSSLNVALQTVVPSWVRGRALSVYMLGIFGGLAAGSALWGAVADRFGTAPALWSAAGGMVLGLAATWRVHLPSGEGLNLAPSRQWPAPRVASDLELESGPVLVTIEYRIDPERAPEFVPAMQDLRRIRLRDGSLQWGLFNDADHPDRWTEVFLVESWIEHLRQHERVTVADEEVRQRAGSFHLGDQPPEVRHLVAERGPRPS
ncbi:MAG TPA: MFS transporter [Thermoanaerobaculia bacterium]|nr:MFS transporter [Thermoanaerobaculia bacterium]